MHHSKNSVLAYLFLLTGFFCLLQISFIIQSSQLYFGDVKFIAAHLSIPWTVLPGILFFVCAQIFIQLVYTLIVWLAARLAVFALRLPDKRSLQVGIIVWFCATIFILLTNAYHFPNSKFADLLSLNQQSLKILFYLSTIPIISILLLCLLAVADFLVCQHKPVRQKIFIVMLIPLFSFIFLPTTLHVAKDASSAQKPNVIIIGIDALRPDFLSYFGRAEATPHLDNFLNQSFVFAEAMTPLARTFPSWVSILTGLYPKQTNARFDLSQPDTLHISHTLPQILREQGYKTIYGMDDARFSNITSSMGFDKFVTPPIGFNDFFLGSFNDFPLANLLVNTRVGKWLFPYSYGNRADYITYQPSSYIKMWNDVLQKDRTQPLFIAVHFCLPHYPYFWASYGSNTSTHFILDYSNAVSEMDKQFNAFIALLKQQGILQHSIVVLLSDHGEALEFSGDRVTAKDLYVAGAQNTKHVIPHFYPPAVIDEAVDQSAGHGTDVLGLPQYHSVLAFRLEGLANDVKNPLQPISGVVSLLQIKATILNLLHMANEKNGLENILLGKQTSISNQKDFFMESDFSPEAVRSVHPETKKLLFEGIDFFQIDPKTTHITIRKSMADMILSSKQYADLYQNWILALYPETNHRYVSILVNLQNGKWTDDMSSAFALHSPYLHMLDALKKFYGADLSL